MSSEVVYEERPVQVNELAAGPARFDAPPRRVWAWQLPAILDSGQHGRPTWRHCSIATLGILLALSVIAPDLAYGLFPTYDLTVVDAHPRTLPDALGPVAEAVPEGLLGYSSTFRLPAGGVRSGPISADEFAAIEAGATTLPVHVSGGDFPRGWPVSGRFELTRLAAAGICLVFALAFGIRVLVTLRSRWWMVRLMRKGEEIVGRVTEFRAQRVVRREEPVAWRFDVYYEYPVGSSAKQGSVTSFQIEEYLPYHVDGPIRVLHIKEPRPISIPTDFLPTARRTAD